MTRRNIPELYIEQFLLDELPEDRMDRVLSSPELKTRADELKRSNEEILETYRPELMAARIRTELEQQDGRTDNEKTSAARFQNRWIPLLAAAVLAVVVYTAFPGRFQGSGADTGPAAELTRIKGASPSLSIYRQAGDGSEQLADGSRAFPRDLLQIGYIPAGMQFGAILSIDGRGQVTLHYPEHINESKKLKTGGEILLPFSYELDDAPDFERFFFIASEKDFSLSSVILSAESIAASREGLLLDRLPLPESFYQDSIVLMKE